MSEKYITVDGNSYHVAPSYASPRQTYSPPGTPIGNWTVQAINVGVMTCSSSQDHPDGVFEFADKGFLTIELTDVATFAPYIAVELWDPSDTQLEATVEIGERFENGNRVFRSQPAVYDAALGAYVAVGPVSDGSIGGAGWTNLIHFRPNNEAAWAMRRAGIGWLQL